MAWKLFEALPLQSTRLSASHSLRFQSLAHFLFSASETWIHTTTAAHVVLRCTSRDWCSLRNSADGVICRIGCSWSAVIFVTNFGILIKPFAAKPIWMFCLYNELRRHAEISASSFPNKCVTNSTISRDGGLERPGQEQSNHGWTVIRFRVPTTVGHSSDCATRAYETRWKCAPKYKFRHFTEPYKKVRYLVQIYVHLNLQTSSQQISSSLAACIQIICSPNIGVGHRCVLSSL